MTLSFSLFSGSVVSLTFRLVELPHLGGGGIVTLSGMHS